MKELQLREAKSTLSAVVEAAEHGEPTTITKHGRPAPSSISYEEWAKLKAGPFLDLFWRFPNLPWRTCREAFRPDCA